MINPHGGETAQAVIHVITPPSNWLHGPFNLGSNHLPCRK